MKRDTFLAFTGPSIIIMSLLMVLPLITAIWLGFTSVTFRTLNAPQWIGFQNYVDVLTDHEFWDAMGFTLLYTQIVVPIQMGLGFLLALLLNQVSRFRRFYIAGLLLPFIVTPVVGALMFRSLFARGGLYSYLLNELFGYRFVMTTETVRTLIMAHGIWYMTPFAMIVVFAALQTLPQGRLDAAIVEGANTWQQLRIVILPHLRAPLVFIALISIMDTYRVFDSVFVLTQQNPIFNADTIMTYNFQVALSATRLGKANAIAILTVLGIVLALLPFLYITYQEQFEE